MAREENIQTLYNKLKTEFGFTDKQISGIIGNLDFESNGLDPKAIELNPKNENSEGVGIAQWSRKRRHNLESWASENNKDINSITAQTEFLTKELKDWPELVKKIKKEKSIEGATKVFMDNFENPDKKLSHYDKRVNKANEISKSFLPQEQDEFIEEVTQPEQVPEITSGGSGESISFDRESEQSAVSPQNLYKNDYDLSGFNIPKQLDNISEQPVLFPSSSTPVNVKETGSAGFFSTGYHSFLENNGIYQQGAKLVSRFNETNPYTNNKEPNWTPYKEENFVGVDSKYWPLIADAESPDDLGKIHDDIAQRMIKDQEYENGSSIAKFIGGVAGFAAGPGMIPIAGTVQYAKTAEFTLKNLMMKIPGLTASSALHEIMIETAQTNPKLEEAAYNTLRDTAIGVAIEGVILGSQLGVRANNIYNSRKTLNFQNMEGLTPHYEVNSKGVLTGRKIAVAEAGSSVGARETSFAQEYLDTTLADKGLFAVPYMKNVLGYISPKVAALTNPYPSARAFLGRATGHNFLTEGTEAGQPRPENFEETLSKYRTETKVFTNMLKGMYHEANGITPGGSQGIKALQQRFNKEQMYTEASFGFHVVNKILSGTEHSNKTINEAAALVEEHMTKTYENYRDAFGLDEKFMSPRTAVGYFSRMWNHDAIIGKEKNWRTSITNEFKEQDALIANKEAPVKRWKDKIKAEKKPKLKKQLKRDLENYNNNLSNEILLDPDLYMLAEMPSHLSHDESMELESLLSKQNSFKEEIEGYKKERKKLGKKKANKEARDNIEEKMRASEEAMIADMESLNDMALNGKVNSRLYYKDKDGDIIFKDPKLKLKFRSKFESDFHRLQTAISIKEKILGQTIDDLQTEIMSQQNHVGTPIPVHQRTFMIKDTTLLDPGNGFIHSNLEQVITAYDGFMNKRAALRQTYKDVSVDGGIEPLIEQVRKENKSLIEKTLKLHKNDDVKLEAALRKINKQFESTINQMSNTHDAMMGKTAVSQGTRNAIAAATNYTAAIRLGSVPLTQVADIAAVMLQQGVWPTIHSGLYPLLKSLGGTLDNKTGKAFREMAAHVGISTEHLNGHNMSRFTNHTTWDDTPGTGKISAVTGIMADHTFALTLQSRLDNVLHKLAAGTADSVIISSMHKHLARKISKSELDDLLILGLDPEVWAGKFIKGWEEAGADSSVAGGFMSHFYKWGDQDAANAMSDALYKAVRGSILKRDFQSSPSFMNNPVWGMLMLFKGWGFEAFSRFTLPTLQKLEANKLAGIIAMLSAGALVGPMRRMSRGESPIDENDPPERIFWEALANSGVLGIFTDAIEDVNILMEGRMLKKLQSDKYRTRAVSGMVAGPVGGVIDDFFSLANMPFNGVNKAGLKKLARWIPYTNLWWDKGLINKFINSQNIPETAAEAKRN